MCNKYGYNSPLHRLIETFQQVGLPFEAPGALPNLGEMDAIRPTDLAPVAVRAGEGVALEQMRWGFVNPRPKAGPVINFRSEGRSFASGRCLVPATHFFEFTGAKYPKSQWRFTIPDTEIFCMAGLCRPGGDGEPARFTLLTIDAGADVAPYHDRQIVPLRPADWSAWLDPAADAHALLRPLPAGTLAVQKVA